LPRRGLVYCSKSQIIGRSILDRRKQGNSEQREVLDVQKDSFQMVGNLGRRTSDELGPIKEFRNSLVLRRNGGVRFSDLPYTVCAIAPGRALRMP